MTNEIGMLVKSGPGPTERTSPTAKPGKAEAAESVQHKAQAEREARAAEAARAEELAQQVATGLNDLVHELHRELHFSVDNDSGDTIIKVIDRETDEVVRQIPSEEVVRLRKRLQEASGVIFQDSA